MLGISPISSLMANSLAKYVKVSEDRRVKINTIIDLKDWLYSLCIKLFKKINEVDEKFKEKIIYGGVKYINLNYTNDISLSEAAEVSNLSVHYFSRVFKKEMGCTFKEYITTLRIESAKRKLKNEDENISNIAKEVGYNNSGYFSRVFKEYEGISPSTYRNS